MATHVKVIAVLYLICGASLALGAFFLPAILGMVAALVGSSGDPDAGMASAILGLTGIGVSVMFIAFAIPFIVIGWGMLTFRPWSRSAGIVLGVLCLPQIPVGTVIGIYALVILFRKDTEALFVAKA